MSLIAKLAILPGLSALILSFISTPLAIKTAKKLRLIDDPKTHKHPKVIHKYPVPRGGIISIFIGVFASTLLFLPFDRHISGILAGAFILTVLGLFDYKFDLNPHFRLFIMFLAAAFPIASGIGVPFIKIPYIADAVSASSLLNNFIYADPTRDIIELSHPQIAVSIFGSVHNILILADIFAFIWIVYLMNILNMGAKGIDGQLPGVVVIAAITIAALSLKYSADITQWPIIILASITAGTYLGFLPWNFYPQKIMPGFGGSTLAGYLLAILSILSTAKVGTLLVVLGIPLMDSGYAVVRRVASGKSPVWGDRKHLHHKLLDLGLNKRQVAILYWVTTAFLGILALNLKSDYKLYTIVGVAILVGGIMLWITYRPIKKL